jgi:predicted oxidoreductase
MKTYHIPHTDLVVSRIAYGCTGALEKAIHLSERFADLLRTDGLATAMSVMKPEPPSVDAIAKVARAINTAYENGITFFDHADIYISGMSEAVFGEVLKERPGLRPKIVIQSKCGIRFQDDPQPGDPNRMDFSREHIVSSAEGSLKRLGTDHLDILLLHRPDALAEPQEVAQAFDELHRSGKVRYFGVSNHTAGQIELLKKYVRKPLVANQLQLGLAHSHLIADGIEANRDDSTRITHGYTGVAGTLDYCRLHDMQVQAYAPLRGGNSANPPNLLNPPADASLQLKQAAKVLSDMARKKSTAPSAISLAWLLRHPAGIVPIIGTSEPEHVIESCAADRVTLSREEWYELFASVTGVSSLLMLGVVLPKEWLSA